MTKATHDLIDTLESVLSMLQVVEALAGITGDQSVKEHQLVAFGVLYIAESARDKLSKCIEKLDSH